MGRMIETMIDVGGGVRLEAAIFEPRQVHPFATIILSTGICMQYRDYLQILEPLSDAVRIVAYNYRGHGASGGVFEARQVVADLAALASREVSPLFLAGHSTGANISASVDTPVSGRIFLCPYIEPSYLAKGRRRVLAAASRMPGMFQLIDRALTAFGLARRFGFKNSRPLSDLLELSKMTSSKSRNIPALWMIPDRDEILGTWRNPEHLESIKLSLHIAYHSGSDRSDILSGLNHCFNTQVGNLFQMFNCPPETKQAIVDTILQFCWSSIANASPMRTSKSQSSVDDKTDPAKLWPKR